MSLIEQLAKADQLLTTAKFAHLKAWRTDDGQRTFNEYEAAKKNFQDLLDQIAASFKKYHR